MHKAIDDRYRARGAADHRHEYDDEITEEMLEEARRRFEIPADAPRDIVLAMAMRDTPHTIHLPVFNKMKWTCFAGRRPCVVGSFLIRS